MDSNCTTTRALRDLVALWAAAAIAASAWASGIHEEGFLLESSTWHADVAGVPSPDWPVDGWYRLSPTARSIDVRAAMPSAAERRDDPQGTVYVRVPGTHLKEGLRTKYRFNNPALRPKPGHPYELLLGKTRFSFVVESSAEGTRYDVTYGGDTRSYLLGLPGAATQVRAIADLDGDAMPDFLVDVGDQAFLLLSTRAIPGHNPPTAQAWSPGEAHGC